MSKENSTCPICAAPTFLVYGKYPRKDGLCKECSQKLFNKEIKQCEACGEWHKSGEACICKKSTPTATAKKSPKAETASDTACIIPSVQERAVYADWYIPLSGAKGIYIEYWGMDKQDYQDNKEEKLKLYEKYKDRVKLIQIDKNDINDKQTLESRLYEELVSLGWEAPKY